MKETLLTAYRNIPKFEEHTAIQEIMESRIEVSITENIECEFLDLLLDKTKEKLYMYVDGKVKSKKALFWKKKFMDSYDPDYLIKACDFDLAIIRLACNETPEFMKVMQVFSVSAETKKPQTISLSKLPVFCQNINLSPMPVVYKGPLNSERIKDLLTVPMLGVPRKGLLIVPERLPVKYIQISKGDPLGVANPKKLARDPRGAEMLAEEFANRSFDEREIMQEVHTTLALDNFIKKVFRRAKTNTLVDEYMDRCEREHGVERGESNALLYEALDLRAKKMFHRLNIAAR